MASRPKRVNPRTSLSQRDSKLSRPRCRLNPEIAQHPERSDTNSISMRSLNVKRNKNVVTYLFTRLGSYVPRTVLSRVNKEAPSVFLNPRRGSERTTASLYKKTRDGLFSSLGALRCGSLSLP